MTKPATSRPLALPRTLGYAGLLPQAGAVAAMAIGPAEWHFAALSLTFAYSALILSFLGGTWWGLAARHPGQPPNWVWFAAVAPSLVALASAVPWAIGTAWPTPSLVLLGLALLASLLIDRKLAADGLAPAWWMSLRLPLSVGLGGLTLLTAMLG